MNILCIFTDTTDTELNKYLIVVFVDKGMSGNDVTEATFKGNISVEAEQKNKKELTPDYCFGLYKNDTGMTATLADYYCYEGNSYGYDDITDIVIPSEIDGYKITSLIYSNWGCAMQNSGCGFHNIKIDSLFIPDSVTTIDGQVFLNSQLTNIIIPASVTNISGDAFNGNPLLHINIDFNNPVYDSRDNSNAIIETSSNTLISGNKNTIIPNTVTNIGKFAFSDSQLTNINIPNSVTTIGNYAFYGNQLTSINIPDSVTEIGYDAFQYNNLNYVYIGSNSKLTSIGSEAFSSSNNTFGDYVDNPNLKVIYNNSGKAFDWNNIVNGSTGTSFITGTTNTRTLGSTTYNSVEIKTGNP